MIHTLSRRRLLATAPAALGGLLGEGRPRLAAEESPAGRTPTLYPTQDPELVQRVVARSHFDLDAVRELVEARPELSRAAWDWGFGDWESALGAAAHMGRRDIAELLMEKGARPDLFAFAMLGHVDVVRALVAARPGIERLAGPHGITLLAHARAGGERAKDVVEFLEELGGADEGPLDLPLDDADRRALLGVYTFGPDDAARFEVLLDRRGQLSLQRTGGIARTLFHQGEAEFHPAGAPSARICFLRKGDRIVGFEIHNPGPVVRAERI